MDSSEPIPLMEGEGRSFRVLGFSQNQRAAFVQILMRLIIFGTLVVFYYIYSTPFFLLLWIVDYRFGVGDFDWKEFTPRLKQKSFEEIREY